MTSLDQVPLFASLATGSNLEESLNILNLTPAEVNERLQEVSDLINRLEDTAALLRQHLHATKHAFDSRVESDGDPSSKMHIPKVLRYHLPIVAVIQLVCVTILAGYDHWLLKTGKPYTILADTIMVILQLLIVIQVVLATVELSRKLLKYGVPGSFLAQTYFSTVLAFAGIYFMIYRFDRASWDVASGMGEGGAAFSEFIRMLYLSVSSATLCGAANIQPAVWYTILLVCMQSLINFVYFASILAQTIGNYNSYTVHVQRSESLSRLTNSVSIQNVS